MSSKNLGRIKSLISSANKEAIVIMIVNISKTLDSTIQASILINLFQQPNFTSSSSSLDEWILVETFSTSLCHYSFKLKYA